MNFDRFVELMQDLITMTNPGNGKGMIYAQNILVNLIELACSSQMVDELTLRAMGDGLHDFPSLMHEKEDFAVKPGDVEGNMARLKELALMLQPGC